VIVATAAHTGVRSEPATDLTAHPR
jgi:hypothetical protein